MDNKQYKTLVILYKALLAKPKTNLSELLITLQTNAQILHVLISELQNMGLDINISDDKICLINSIDEINETKINQLIHSKTNKTIYYCFSTISTNELARKGNTNRIYLADFQSQGKGRQAKQWITPLGQSIALSISHNFDFGLSEISGLNIAIGVAIIQTANKYGYNHLGLKWPNDILGSKGKVAGILIEATGNNKKCNVIIGIGINWNIRQSLLDKIEQDCMNIKIKNTSRPEFTAELIIQIDLILKEFSKNKLTNIYKDWYRNDVFTNQTINILQNSKITQAKYIGVNKQGLLKVVINKVLKTIASGEVSIRKVD